ncbi:MAG: Invasion associated protein p60 [uncultured Sulfurovum sp.]|uniref:Invasion associated protein p60 n=1 Tax=uncultured Sulfurovum sp. TaxID=269237 RepID=A0A6S6T535_9BACT|nr:MAG: Invasion associated protein p60 [uncultured Sulfurovum sp.]
MLIQKNFLILLTIILFSISLKAKDFDYYKNIYIEKVAKAQLGKKYVWGGNGRRGYDCSGFTKKVFAKNGIKIPRNSWKQAKVGQKVSRGNLKKGDLIFFNSRKQKRVNHVGIYLGNGRFIHASSFHKRIVISKFKEYKRYFKWGRRLT